MQTEVTQAQIDQYQAQGFIVLENFLDAAELEHWRNMTADAIRVRLSTQNNLTNQADPDAFYAQVFTQALRLADIHDGMAELIFDERLGRVAGTLAGVDGIRIWHDQALVKPPYGNHTAFHMDNPFWSFSSKDAISLWVALDDATLANGCLWYLPGTHKEATYEATGITESLGGLFKLYPQWKKLKAVPTDCPAGSVVYHNGLIAHGAGVNMTPFPRRAMTCAYMPDGSTFNGKKNILPDDYFQSLKVGDLLNDESINRLIWRREGMPQAA